MPTPTEHEFKDRLAALPTQPGVYLMRGAGDQVLYVGKSASLRNRVRSYFGARTGMPMKTRELVSHIEDFEYIVTESEQEALLLENSLIKQHKPRFNARLKDDKTYPYIKVDLDEPFPRVYVTRSTSRDNGRYFGPFASAGSVRKTLDLLNRLFPYRSCTKTITGTDDRPCLEYFIKRCVAPCTGYVDQSEYRLVIGQILLFLEGKTREVVTELKSAMRTASDQLEFERAAALRDRLRAIERVYEGQKVVGLGREDLDVIAVAYGNNEAWVEVFFVRHGNLIGRDNFIMEGTQNDQLTSILSQFAKQFYDSASHVPRRMLVHARPEDEALILDWLREKRQGPVDFAVPQRGPKKRLIDMVQENAEQGLKQLNLKWHADSDLMAEAMSELQEQLSLPRLPKRIECFDISHIQGTNTVASMSVMENGKPRSGHYRKFRIKTVEGNDDFGSIREVMNRRFKRLKDAINGQGKPAGAKPDSFDEMPDLVLIDGGKGQLSSALEAMLYQGLREVPLASLAKKNEEIFVPDSPEPIVLPRNSRALFLVQRARDEAHRFAISYHRSMRQKSSIKSALDLVPGIGPKRKKSLIRKFGSVKRIKEAPIEEVAASPGMTATLAAKVKEYL